MGNIVLIGGGVRSGKSAFALARARRHSPPRIFVATAQAHDGEMRTRAERHRHERGPDFETMEEPQDLLHAIRGAVAGVVVIDCLTLWLSNRLLSGESSDQTLFALEALLLHLGRMPCDSLIVTNEVGMGIVPETPLGRAFRDLAGAAHQRIARVAGEIHVATLGVVVRVHPAPIEVSCRGGIL